MNETEINLAIDPPELDWAITAIPWLNEMTDGSTTSQKLVSVYFDTAEFRLKQNGFALSVRSDGNKKVQRIKTATNIPFTRGEWQHEIKTDEPDLKLAKATAMKPLIRRKLQRALHPLFVTDILRETMLLRRDDTTIEMAIDRGEIKCGQKTVLVNELELELKSGDRGVIVGIARRLANEMKLKFGVRTKPERGYRLVSGYAPFHGEPLILDRNATIADTFKTIAMSCLRHFALNDDAIIHADADAIHQMRVGLRRLRAAMSIFKEIVSDAESTDVRANLKWLLNQLGHARDTDVMLKETIAPLLKKQKRQDLAVLRDDLQKQRSDAFEKAKQTVQSDQFRRLVLQVALWIDGGKWCRNEDSVQVARQQCLITEFAPEVLTKRNKKVVAQLGTLAELGPTQRHKLRIAIKKLRYTMEFFGSLYSDGKVYGKTLKQLQDALGRLNDISVHTSFGDRVITTGDGIKGRQVSFAIGYVAGHEQSEIDGLMQKAIKAGDTLRGLPKFWR